MRGPTLIMLLAAALVVLSATGADAQGQWKAATCTCTCCPTNQTSQAACGSDLRTVILTVANEGDCNPTGCRLRFPALCPIAPAFVGAYFTPSSTGLASWEIALIVLSAILMLLLSTLLLCLMCRGCPLHDLRLKMAPNVVVQVPQGSKVEMNEGVIKAIGPDGKPLEVVGVQGAGLNEIKIHPANRVA